jgi:hypothetical protein
MPVDRHDNNGDGYSHLLYLALAFTLGKRHGQPFFNYPLAFCKVTVQKQVSFHTPNLLALILGRSANPAANCSALS